MRGDLADLRAVLRFKPLGMTQLLAEVGALLGNPPGSSSTPEHRLVS